MTLGMAYLAVHVTGKNFIKLYPTLHHPTLLPIGGPSKEEDTLPALQYTAMIT